MMPRLVLNSLGPISPTDLRLASYHFVSDLRPKIGLSLLVKLAPGCSHSAEPGPSLHFFQFCILNVIDAP